MRLFFFLCFLLCNSACFAVQDTLQLSKKIDSLKQSKNHDYDEKDYATFHKIKESAKSIKYNKGVVEAQIEIIKYHCIHNIDSLLYYHKRFQEYQQRHFDRALTLLYLKSVGYFLLYYNRIPEYSLPIYMDALKLCGEKDIKSKCNITQGIADSYLYKGQYDMVVPQIKKILKDTTHISFRSKVVLKVTQAIAYQFLDKVESSKSLLKGVIYESGTRGDSLLYSYAKIYQSYNYYLEKHYQKSLDTLNANFHTLKKYWPSGTINYYEFSALSYAKLGQHRKAVDFIRKALQRSPANELPKLYDRLSDSYLKLDMRDSAWYFNAQKEHIQDSVRHLEKRGFTNLYRTKVDFIETVLENKKIKLEQSILSKTNHKQKYYITNLYIGIVSLIIGIIVFALRKMNKPSKNEESTLRTHEKKALQNQVKLREDELSVMLIGAEKKMKELKTIQNQMHTAVDERNLEKLKNPLKIFDSFLKKNVIDDAITARMESQYPGLVIQLKELFPQLSKTDIKHCLLVKLGFSIKESAALLNVNQNTVKTARYRAKSKLGLCKNMSLHDFLHHQGSTSSIKDSCDT